MNTNYSRSVIFSSTGLTGIRNNASERAWRATMTATSSKSPHIGLRAGASGLGSGRLIEQCNRTAQATTMEIEVIDPDDAPELTDEMMDRAIYKINGKVVTREEWRIAAKKQLIGMGAAPLPPVSAAGKQP